MRIDNQSIPRILLFVGALPTAQMLLVASRGQPSAEPLSAIVSAIMSGELALGFLGVFLLTHRKAWLLGTTAMCVAAAERIARYFVLRDVLERARPDMAYSSSTMAFGVFVWGGVAAASAGALLLERRRTAPKLGLAAGASFAVAASTQALWGALLLLTGSRILSAEPVARILLGVIGAAEVLGKVLTTVVFVLVMRRDHTPPCAA